MPSWRSSRSNSEVCDGIDNDCIGGVPATETDDDGDGYVECVWIGSSSAVFGGLDCDDTPGSGVARSPALAEVCDDGIDNNCVDGVDEGCAPPSANYSGDWSLIPTIGYYCADSGLFGYMVSVSLASVRITDTNPNIVVTGLPIWTTQPGVMNGTFSSATEFSASSVIPGGAFGCTETYTISGEFTSSTTLTATITADYYATNSLGCGDAVSFPPECLAQSWNVSGVR